MEKKDGDEIETNWADVGAYRAEYFQISKDGHGFIIRKYIGDSTKLQEGPVHCQGSHPKP